MGEDGSTPRIPDKLFFKIGEVAQTIRSNRVSSQFAEHIMNAVTAVNGCTYCSWAHTKAALKSGCSTEELEAIKGLDFSGCNREEVVALAFAQHYAETRGNPSRDARIQLVETYGKEAAGDILNYIQMITIGNLCGNSFDGFRSRLRGKPPHNGSILFELFTILFGYPMLWMMKLDGKKQERRAAWTAWRAARDPEKTGVRSK